MSQLISTYNQLSKLFSSVSSFEKTYLRSMKDATPSQWGLEIKGLLYQVHNFLKGIFSEKGLPDSETVILWVNKIKSLYEGAKIINRSIDNEIMRCEAYKEIPEAYYPEEMIIDELKRTGKNHDDLLKEIEIDIKKNHERYSKLLPYSQEGENVLKFVVSTMEKTFRPILQPYNFKVENTIQKKQEKPFSRSPINHDVRPFECPQNQKQLISKIHDQLISKGFITSRKDEFVMIFDSKPSSIKINWTKKLNHLHDFIDKLCGYLNIDKTNQWLITETYFLVKGKPIKAKSLQHYNKISNTSAKKIDRLFS